MKRCCACFVLGEISVLSECRSKLSDTTGLDETSRLSVAVGRQLICSVTYCGRRPSAVELRLLCRTSSDVPYVL